MNDLKTLIDELVEFGVVSHVKSDNKLKRLKVLLTKIYGKYLEASYDFDENDYKKPPNFEYKEIRKTVQSNFEELGFYHSVTSSQDISLDADVIMGDAVDDLTDIIKDMLNVKWRFENTSSNDALWHFQFFFRSHSEQHLVDLLKYLKDHDG